MGGASGVSPCAARRARCRRAMRRSLPARRRHQPCRGLPRAGRQLQQLRARCRWPYGAGGPNTAFALITAHSMARAAPSARTSAVCVAQRVTPGIPHAMFDKPLTLEESSARGMADPLHLYDCGMPCAGGEGFLVMSEERARARGRPFVTCSRRRTAQRLREVAIMIRGGWPLFCAVATTTPGSPRDIDLVQLRRLPGDFHAAIRAPRLLRPRRAPPSCARPRWTSRAPCRTTPPAASSRGRGRRSGRLLGLVETLRQVTGQALARRCRARRRAGRRFRHDHLRPVPVHWGFDPEAFVMRCLRAVERPGARHGSAFSGPHRGPPASVRAGYVILADQARTAQANRERGQRPRTRTPRPATARGCSTRRTASSWGSVAVVLAGAGPVRGTLAHGPLGWC